MYEIYVSRNARNTSVRSGSNSEIGVSVEE